MRLQQPIPEMPASRGVSSPNLIQEATALNTVARRTSGGHPLPGQSRTVTRQPRHLLPTTGWSLTREHLDTARRYARRPAHAKLIRPGVDGGWMLSSPHLRSADGCLGSSRPFSTSGANPFSPQRLKRLYYARPGGSNSSPPVDHLKPDAPPPGRRTHLTLWASRPGMSRAMSPMQQMKLLCLLDDAGPHLRPRTSKSPR